MVKWNMYRIGEFAKIVDIPVRTLRFYDQYGVLQPSDIDRFTGYRYYTDENILECELIKLLKSVDFTLEEIILYKNNLTNDVLGRKQQEIKQQIELLNNKYKRLSVMKEEMLKDRPKQKTYSKINDESMEEKILRRKYERRNINKNL